MPFCFIFQKFDEIGRSLVELCPKTIFMMVDGCHLEFLKFYVTVIRFIICCSKPNFIKIGRFFTEIW